MAKKKIDWKDDPKELKKALAELKKSSRKYDDQWHMDRIDRALDKAMTKVIEELGL
jgi:hypothetical protein